MYVLKIFNSVVKFLFYYVSIFKLQKKIVTKALPVVNIILKLKTFTIKTYVTDLTLQIPLKIFLYINNIICNLHIIAKFSWSSKSWYIEKIFGRIIRFGDKTKSFSFYSKKFVEILPPSLIDSLLYIWVFGSSIHFYTFFFVVISILKKTSPKIVCPYFFSKAFLFQKTKSPTLITTYYTLSHKLIILTHIELIL